MQKELSSFYRSADIHLARGRVPFGKLRTSCFYENNIANRKKTTSCKTLHRRIFPCAPRYFLIVRRTNEGKRLKTLALLELIYDPPANLDVCELYLKELADVSIGRFFCGLRW